MIWEEFESGRIGSRLGLDVYCSTCWGYRETLLMARSQHRSVASLRRGDGRYSCRLVDITGSSSSADIIECVVPSWSV